MSESELKPLDQRLLTAGYMAAASGYGMLLLAVAYPTARWLAARDTIDTTTTLVWMFSFALLGAALVNAGNRLRRAYRSGAQSGF